MNRPRDIYKRFLELLPEDGTPVPNSVLRKKLQLSNEEYWQVRNKLLGEGRVTRSPGRGGRTALAVDSTDASEESVTWVRTWMTNTAFAIAVLLLLVVPAKVVLGRDWARWLWDTPALVFGSVTVASVGLSLLIYRSQALTAASEAQSQAHLLRELMGHAKQAADSATDSRDLLQAMEPAVTKASAGGDPHTAVDEPDSGALQEPISDIQRRAQDDWTIKQDHGTYYRPPAVPLRVIGDLVQWWDNSGERGRWTVSQLVGGYRAFNQNGTFVGVPWILTFKNEAGESRSFRVSYSGRQKGPAVSELSEDGGWCDFDSSACRQKSDDSREAGN